VTQYQIIATVGTRDFLMLNSTNYFISSGWHVKLWQWFTIKSL